MLTGKNKKQFEEWLHSNYYDKEEFDNDPLACQWGVIQDYADSIGYELSCGHNGEKFTYHVKRFDCPIFQSRTRETRDEARKAAIKAFDDVVNSAT
jgi:hypothetical protein